MLKNILIAMYILIVLAISAVARAEYNINEVTVVNPVDMEIIMDANRQLGRSALQMNSSDQKVLQPTKHILENQIKVQGIVAMTVQGDYVLALNQNDYVFLKSKKFDLSQLIGHVVVVDGFILNLQIAPVYQEAGLDPLSDLNSQNGRPAVYVLSYIVPPVKP